MSARAEARSSAIGRLSGTGSARSHPLVKSPGTETTETNAAPACQLCDLARGFAARLVGIGPYDDSSICERAPVSFAVGVRTARPRHRNVVGKMLLSRVGSLFTFDDQHRRVWASRKAIQTVKWPRSGECSPPPSARAVRQATPRSWKDLLAGRRIEARDVTEQVTGLIDVSPHGGRLAELAVSELGCRCILWHRDDGHQVLARGNDFADCGVRLVRRQRCKGIGRECMRHCPSSVEMPSMAASFRAAAT
jgi:hypothetical protein